MIICLSEGSNSSIFGSMSIGDWFLPLVHMNQSLFSRPQKAGPETITATMKEYLMQ